MSEDILRGEKRMSNGASIDGGDCMSGETYAIRTVADFLAVPRDRLDLCIRDFREWIRMADALAFANDVIGAPIMKMNADVFQWINDDKRQAYVIIRDGNGDEIATATIKMKQE